MPPFDVAIACDHAGFPLKSPLLAALEARGVAVLDLGTGGAERVDYPDFANLLAAALKDGRAARGILICGSGIGISMAANRFPWVRAALVHDALGARMSRLHNDANVIVFGSRMIGIDVAVDALETFLDTAFEGGRHARRVAMLSEPPLMNGPTYEGIAVP
ncbi:ribose 5-phosphate isomerase B [Magnetospira sp. QH-2]|uniref:ribose 5-phosphate isomerase B n=1 Tax=Magnetospira sp. (strain QH-2) TaxID=1288970 RepID=UPI0003E8142B|nr:ribose 5-phosphate isomerase B [Magnetospira sp. QH-2]CCQ73833.1 Ribose-5-phosphate isomerase B [Magnetospira sp. QH-2]